MTDGIKSYPYVAPGGLSSEARSTNDAAHRASEAPARMGWARLLKRVFDIDLEHCPQCGGDFKIIAAIEERAVIVRILTHLGLPACAAALTGAAAVSLPGSLILEVTTVLQRA